jgi:hypothetical protein
MSSQHGQHNLQTIRFFSAFAIIGSLHAMISYLLWQPNCSPGVLDLIGMILDAPGFLLRFVPYYVAPAGRGSLYQPFTIIVSSCLYGLAGGLLFSSEKKRMQVVGIILLGVLFYSGYYFIRAFHESCP